MKTYKVEVTETVTKWYNESNELHRENGPAVERANGDKSYFINDKLHREDGPAVERANGYKFYYINGEELAEQEFRNKACKTVVVDGVKYKLVKI